MLFHAWINCLLCTNLINMKYIITKPLTFPWINRRMDAICDTTTGLMHFVTQSQGWSNFWHNQWVDAICDKTTGLMQIVKQPQNWCNLWHNHMVDEISNKTTGLMQIVTQPQNGCNLWHYNKTTGLMQFVTQPRGHFGKTNFLRALFLVLRTTCFFLKPAPQQLI